MACERVPGGLWVTREGIRVYFTDADVCDLMEAIRENRWCFRRRETRPATGPTGDHCGMQEERCAASV